ncbi:hypothetical protein HNY73_019835 [Argiope bruennichi]|uniref:Uncharacterized protein n=1 Tax=Argiope bruennichi TaxID=94029 RepID=A0A8T0E5Z2_ARGBR|nr:hypothetical protein HNY73_019835 [Argiope bruennichi]
MTFLCGASSLEEAKELKSQLSGILAKGGMQLHKWSSSHLELASNIDGGYDFENLIETKTLGVSWKSLEDCFVFRVAVDLKNSYNKRCVISTIARLFDPLGLLGPVVAKAKIFMQSLWSLKIDWMDELPPERANEWHQFLEDFKSINSICIKRCICIKRFLNNCRVNFPKDFGILKAIELKESEMRLLKIVQEEDFHKEIKSLKAGGMLRRQRQRHLVSFL